MRGADGTAPGTFVAVASPVIGIVLFAVVTGNGYRLKAGFVSRNSHDAFQTTQERPYFVVLRSPVSTTRPFLTSSPRRLRMLWSVAESGQ